MQFEKVYCDLLPNNYSFQEEKKHFLIYINSETSQCTVKNVNFADFEDISEFLEALFLQI